MFDPKLESRLNSMVTIAVCSHIPPCYFVHIIETKYLGEDREQVAAFPCAKGKYDFVINTADPLVKSLREEMKTLLPTVAPLDERMDKLNAEISRLETPSGPWDDGRPLEVWMSSYPHTDELDRLKVENIKLDKEKDAIIARYAKTNATVKKLVDIINSYKAR